MSTTIESLELEILSSSTSAEKGIENLSQSLTRLKTATKGGLGLTSVTKQLTKLNDALNNINSGSVKKVEGIANAIKLFNSVKISSTIGKQITEISNAMIGVDASSSGKVSSLATSLQAFSGIKISSNIGNQLTAINTALNTMNIDSSVNKKIQDLVVALQPLYNLPKQNVSSLISQLGKLPKVLTDLNAVDMTAFGNKILDVANAIKPLADEMYKVAAGFSAFPTKIQKLISNTNTLSKSNKSLTGSFTDLYHVGQTVINTLSRVGKAIYSVIGKSSDYIEDFNLFDVAMGEYAQGAKEYADQVSEAMGIDPGEWMRNQGLFQTLITGFGVAGDSASEMSQNLTQLAYDLSSFYNIDVETAMQKLKSGMAGELEPLRAIGYDLSQAKLEATAAELGIDKAVSSMTQAEKSMLRYHAIMTQVTDTHGDMARTLDQPANQIRVLKAQLEMLGRELGNVFIPMLQTVLPYVIAITKVLREMVSAVALLVGYEPPELKNTGVNELASGMEETEQSLKGANEEVKKLKSYMLGIDELNVINPNEGADDTTLGAFDIDLPDYGESFLSETMNTKVNEIVEKMKEWLGITDKIDSWSDLFETKLGRILTSVGLIAAGLLLWKLSAPFLKHLDTLSAVLGLTLLIDSVLVTLQEGLSWKSVIEGAIGGALVGAGLGFKLGGWKGAIGGVIIGIGVSLVINGITSMIDEGVNVENVLTLISGVLATVGGIITVVKLFNKTHKSPVKDFATTEKTIGDVSTGTSTLTSTLKTLAKNLALGLAILAEVAAAAILVVGAIWILGLELEQVGIAWTPVIENAGTVAIAVGVGTGLLVGVGVATALLGTLGAPLIVNIALGTAILAEIGVATALFLAEILVVGVLLDKIGEAWEPVLENGDTIAKGIGIGTGLLVAVGVVAAALGVAAVASVGLLPLAIGLGTAMLIELGIAFIAFTDELIKVANQITDKLAPSISGMVLILPDLSTNMEQFTSFMETFVAHVVSFTVSTTISGIAATISKFIGFFTTDPIQMMDDEIATQHTRMVALIDTLKGIIPVIKEATGLAKDYNKFMDEFSTAAGTSNGIGSSTIWGTLANDVATAWDSISEKTEKVWSKVKEKFSQTWTAMTNFVKDPVNSIISGIESLVNGVIRGINGMINALNKISIDVPDWVTKLTGMTKFGFNISTISTIAIPRFAEGGFPESGQTFIAHENGIPEMVGTIGRRTAVANNQQIVESVASGVAEANSEQNTLLREQNALLRALLEKESSVYLDGRELSNSVDKHKREQGRVIIAGGVL